MEIPAWLLEHFKLSHLAIDVVLLVLAEGVTRLAMHTSRAGSGERLKTALLVQLSQFIFLSVCVYTLHHVPFLLFLCDALVLARIASLYCQFWKRRRLPNTSKRLKYATSGVPPPRRSEHDLSVSCYQRPLLSHPNAAAATLNHDRLAQSSALSLPPPLSPHAFPLQHHHRKPPIPFPSSLASTLCRQPLTSTPHNPTHPYHSHSSTSFHAPFQPDYVPQTFTSTGRFPLPFSSPKPPGLLNSGNTCFLNSIIQCLTWSDFKLIDLLTQLLKEAPLLETSIELTEALLAVLQQCSEMERGVLDTSNLLRCISCLAPHLVIPRLPGGGLSGFQSQQDAAEFLLWLLDTLHSICRAAQGGADNSRFTEEKAAEVRALEEERSSLVQVVERMNSGDESTCCDSLDRLAQLDRKLLEIRDPSPIHDVCYGQLIEARECQHCRKISVNVEYFAILPLPVLTSSATIELSHCFQQFCDVEELTRDSNMLHCSCARTRLQDTSSDVLLTPGKRLALLSKLPSRLVLQLTRFTYNIRRKTVLKNQAPVHFPVSGLNVTPYTLTGKFSSKPENNGGALYDLTAFCIHTGAHSTTHGHYLAYCKARNNQWYCFNDDHVQLVGSIGDELRKPFILQNAYILFYSLRN